MKKWLLCLALFVALQHAFAGDGKETSLRRIEAMSAVLANGGIKTLLTEGGANLWTAPYIPSQWHVEHVSSVALKPIHSAARNFGKSLADKLEAQAALMQSVPYSTQLYDETGRLIDLYIWCTNTDGYDNVFLAQRSLDLAAVGIARLAADLSFPVERVGALITRISQERLDINVCVRVLNLEAGADIFLVHNLDEMRRTYGSGVRLLREKRDPSLREKRMKEGEVWNLAETQALKDNLDFFADPDPLELRPDTLLSNWDKKKHVVLVAGLGLDNLNKAKALVAFRQAVGDFPDTIKFTAEELRDRQTGREKMEKIGVKVSKFEETFSSTREAAFSWAWKKYRESQPATNSGLSPQYQNLDVLACAAYSEVKNGKFLDSDSRTLIAHGSSN